MHSIRNGNSRWCDVKKTARIYHSENVLLSLFCFSTFRVCVSICVFSLALSIAHSLVHTPIHTYTRTHIDAVFFSMRECLSVLKHGKEKLLSWWKLSIPYTQNVRAHLCVYACIFGESIVCDVYDIHMRNECFLSFAERLHKWDKYTNEFSG